MMAKEGAVDIRKCSPGGLIFLKDFNGPLLKNLINLKLTATVYGKQIWLESQFHHSQCELRQVTSTLKHWHFALLF